ncbi:MAG: hypothetical protein JJD96_02230 [Thermoleophilia bacterium]|nr:hypothetical protein [Thermoleophilia bacterium]
MSSIYNILLNHRICLTIIAPIFLLLAMCFSAAVANASDEWIYGDSPVAYDLTPCEGTPDISGTNVVWVSGNLNFGHVYYKNLSSPASEQRLSESLNNETQPVISGNLVVWEETYGTTPPYFKVYYKYLDGPGPLPVSDSPFSQRGHDVSGNKIVWSDSRNGNDDIYMFDTTTQQETAVIQKAGNQRTPKIEGDWLIWSEPGYQSGRSNIYAKNIVTSEERQILINTVASIAGISDGQILLLIDAGQNNEIRIFDLATQVIRTIYSKPDVLLGADIDGDKVVWSSMPEWVGVDVAPGKVYVHDLSKDITLSIDTSVGGLSPRISSNRIVWPDARSQNCEQGRYGDIYYTEFGDLEYALAMKYRPDLHLAKDENFGPMPVEQFLTSPGTFLRKRNDPEFDPKANPTAHDLASVSEIVDLFIDVPGQSVEAGGGDSSCSIDRGYINDHYTSTYVQRKDQFPATIYARMVPAETENGNSAIQYWINYYANDHPELFHEGDWELVQVDLNENSDPVQAAYSHHGGGTWRPWDAVEGPNGHPIVYVAAGSHANYFQAGDKFHIFWPLAWDVAQGDGDTWNPAVKLLPEPAEASGTEFDWLNFKGQWGEYTGATLCTGQNGYRDGPDNPTVQNSWNNPFGWADQCDGCQDDTGDGTDVQLTAKSPVDIHIYDSAGRHVGKNATGGIDREIPGSEYLEYPDRKSIIIHGGDINSGFTAEVNGTGTGPCELILTAPDRSGGTVDTLNYQSIQVNPATTATMTVDASKNYTLNLDTNGDGNITPKIPDVTTTKSVDFTPPVQVTDLMASGVSSGSVTLNFMAPGDDGNEGVAKLYDLRYSTSPITDDDWKDAVPVSSLPAPLPAGSTQSVTVAGLEAGTTYYFALRTLDDVALTSPNSNLASATTTMPELGWVMQRVYWASWEDYQSRYLSIDYRMSNLGTGAALESTIQASLCTPDTVYTVTSLPLLVGDIVSGANRTVTLKYFVPTNVGSFATTTFATCNDDASRTYWFPGPLS